MPRRTPLPPATRLAWFREARFGLFLHWGLYAQLGRNEWAMNRERVPRAEYEALADTWHPKPGFARAWARLAKAAGAKYVVLTTKHHEGFCLWDTARRDFCARKRGPGRDLVAEFAEAVRAEGLKVGFYYSLMDWHHPDGARCWKDPAARRRFLDDTRAELEELMTGYGRVDILWYDYAWPLKGAEAWESVEMNARVRELQPHILINNRAWTEEDFGTPEEEIKAADPGRAWEACMTFNGVSWGYMPCAVDWRGTRDVLAMLRQCAAGDGNLLLNVGPAPDGTISDYEADCLRTVGRWIARNAEAVYGRMDRTDGRFEKMPVGQWTSRGKTAYFWVFHWPGREIAIGGPRSTVKRATLLATGREVSFEQTRDRLVLTGLPKRSPDKLAGVTVLKLECASRPRQVLGPGYVVPKGLRWPR